jgi:hypothetical protein
MTVIVMRMRRWTRRKTRDIYYLERILHKLGLRAKSCPNVRIFEISYFQGQRCPARAQGDSLD